MSNFAKKEMRKDIDIPVVEGISVAVVKELNEEKTAEVYNVYILNQKSEPIDDVLVSSRGYGQNKSTGEKITSSTLRHYIGTVKKKSFAKIEPIIEEVFGINNEYWVSFYVGSKIFDKKFIFLPETIVDENMVIVPLIEKTGVLI
ncbi:hypothetical protein OAV92_01880 [Crocinitomicaceae bacterium]|jgi:hypothetical protein|nr:hypothetical protein [Crocinitomicaceae bacterium]